MNCADCYHDNPQAEQCNIAKPGYPFDGDRCRAFFPREVQPVSAGCGLTPEQASNRWPALSRMADVVGWLFGGGA